MWKGGHIFNSSSVKWISFPNVLLSVVGSPLFLHSFNSCVSRFYLYAVICNPCKLWLTTISSFKTPQSGLDVFVLVFYLSKMLKAWETLPFGQLDRPCICNAIYVGGGIGLAAATTIFHGVGSRTTFLIYEDLLFCLVLAYTLVLFGQSLQRKYHLKVPLIFFLKKKKNNPLLCFSTLCESFKFSCGYKRTVYAYLVDAQRISALIPCIFNRIS